MKAATDVLHQRIDARVGRAHFLTSLQGYGDYLARTLQARRRVEALLDRSDAAAIYPAWPDRRLADAMRQDLRALGLPEPANDDSAREPLGVGGVLGALYVLEGSSVGARYIARQVAAMGCDTGTRHLALQTADPAAFRAFLTLLESQPLDPAAEAECLAAAVNAFSCFERCYAA